MQGFLFHDVQSDPLDARRRASEVLLHQVVVQADGFKNLRASVGLHRRNAHLGHHLEDAFFVSLDEVVNGIVRLGAVQLAAFRQVSHRFQRQVGINAAGPVPYEETEVLHLARLPGLDDQADARARAGAGEVVVNGAGGQQAGYRRMRGVHAPVGQDDDVLAILDCLGRRRAKVVQRLL